MRSLLLVAHGSRRTESNDEVRGLAGGLRTRAGGRFGIVECAFLELAEPSIPEGIEACIAAGAGTVVVVPYFLSSGRHVAEDIPELVAAKRRQHPKVHIELAPHLGAAANIGQLLLDQAG
jgi:sirohydrochlorin ferrochelatase